MSFRAHFPRDYPQTPPTLLLTEELIHPNWQYPTRGLQLPHLTKEGWDPDMTIPKVGKQLCVAGDQLVSINVYQCFSLGFRTSYMKASCNVLVSLFVVC